MIGGTLGTVNAPFVCQWKTVRKSRFILLEQYAIAAI
jgi:hypothetical protein